VNNFDYHNVIASFGPEKGERIIVGAHYDTAGALPGADDNASGVAALIELAHLLNKTTLARRVDLVAYTLEEPPYFRTEYMGSAVHVKMLQKQNVQVRMMMALEMIGYFSDEPGSQYYPLPFMNWYYPTKGNYVAVVGNFFKGSDVRQLKQAMQGASDLPVYSINAPGFLPGVDLSDHYNFWQAGYNAVMITNTAFYRNREYHSPFDTEDRLDYIRMGKVVQSVYAAILQLTEDG
jgi:Zn-dependent M28 family amino/carboxypeptidase